MGFVRWGIAAVVGVGLPLLATPPASAQAPALDRAWTAELLDPGRDIMHWDVTAGSAGIGDTVVLFKSGQEIRAAFRPRGATTFSPSQALETVRGFYPTLDASIAGGAVAAWYNSWDDVVKVATAATDATSFSRPTAYPSTGTDYSLGHPRVAVSDSGAAAVVYLAAAPGGLHQLTAVVRAAGGTFGKPESVGPPLPRNQIFARDVDVGEDGTVIVGLVQSGYNAVAVREPSGSWRPIARLGTGSSMLSGNSPRVGLDGLGNAVVAWVDAPLVETAPINVAFSQAGGSFGGAVETAIEVTEIDSVELDVSEIGEAVIVAEASRTNPNGGTNIEGVHAFLANTTLRAVGHPAALTGIWGGSVNLGSNSRGDAVIVWEECCPMALRARRRAPMGTFGPTVEVQPPIDFTGARQGRWPLDADVDEFGNARAAWTDTEPSPTEVYAGIDIPLIDSVLPAVGPLGSALVPIVAGAPSGPWQPAATTTTTKPDASSERRTWPATFRVHAHGAPLAGKSRRIVLTVRPTEDALVSLDAVVEGAPALPRVEAYVRAHRKNRLVLTTPAGKRETFVRAFRHGATMRVRGRFLDVDGDTGKFGERLRLMLPAKGTTLVPAGE